MLSSMSSFYILDINPLSDIICKYLLPFSRFSFCFAAGFLCCAKTFKFDWVQFVYFCFCLPFLRGQIPPNNPTTMSKGILPKFSPRSSMVSGLIFKSLIHFEFIFVYGLRACSNLIVLHVTIQFSQQYLLKRPAFLHCIFLPPLSLIN